MIKPILFNAEMVRAILDERKTVTRRVIKKSQCNGLHKIEPRDWFRECLQEPWRSMTDKEFIKSLYNPPFRRGDILYVRETWSTRQSNACMGNTTTGCPYDNCETASGPCFEDEYIYKATDSLDSSIRKWHPSIHMPKEAARIWLKVTDVRVEHLQDITDAEAEKEGAQPQNPFDYDANKWPNKEHFKEIWNSTIKKSDFEYYGWEANPWVWVIAFERCEKPEGWCV